MKKILILCMAFLLLSSVSAMVYNIGGEFEFKAQKARIIQGKMQDKLDLYATTRDNPRRTSNIHYSIKLTNKDFVGKWKDEKGHSIEYYNARYEGTYRKNGFDSVKTEGLATYLIDRTSRKVWISGYGDKNFEVDNLSYR